MCPSSSAAPSRTPMLNFLSVSARSHRPSLTSPRSRPAGGSDQSIGCPRFARTSVRRSRQRKMDEREAREDEEEEAHAIPSSSRRMLPCLRVSLPHSRTAAASSASHALWPWQCYRHNRASVFVRMCKKCHVACVCRFRGWGLSVFSQDVSMYCKLYQSSKKTICEARGFPCTRFLSHSTNPASFRIFLAAAVTGFSRGALRSLPSERTTFGTCEGNEGKRIRHGEQA